MSLALCPQAVSQASQHFRSSEKRATSKLLWVYFPGYAGVQESDQADRLAGKATVPGRGEVLFDWFNAELCLWSF